MGNFCYPFLLGEINTAQQPFWCKMTLITLVTTEQKPRIAALIPVYNEEPVIEATINTLLMGGFATDDIYIVDDRSTDHTAEFARATGVNVLTVENNGGKAKAQIAALEHFELLVRYEWLVLLDGDTKIGEYFLPAMEKAINDDSTVSLFVGQVKSARSDNIFSAARTCDYAFSHDVIKTGQSNFDVVLVAPGCASMYRASALAELEIDHSTLAEDMDLTIQVHRSGGKVVYISDADVYTQDPGTLNDYHKQILRWARGFWQVAKKHKVFSFQKKQKVDIYMITIALDALFFNRIFWLLLLAWFFPKSILFVMGLDITISFVISLYAAIRDQRFDVVWKFPLYYWISYLNFFVYFRAFVEIMILNKTLLAWNKVARYTF